ncbi:MAG: type II secretion system F family protein [Crenarchaeota archaeon]|nr:type II secretion system F family protein [Thermoproteota archaeon]
MNPGLARETVGSGLAGSLEGYAAMVKLLLLAAAGVAAPVVGVYVYASGATVIEALAASLLAAAAAAMLVIVAATQLPRVVYRNRGALLEPRFPLFAAGLAARLAAGSTLSGALLDMYDKELPDLPEFRVELEYIASGLRAGFEPAVVLEGAAWLTPSQSLRSLFASLAEASRTGTGLVDVVDNLVKEYLLNVESQVDRVVNGLGTLMEFFIALSVMVPVVLVVLGILLAAQPLPALSFKTAAFLAVFVATPVTAAVTIIVADMIVSKVRV